MEIREHKLPLHLSLARDYVENYPSVSECFDYSPQEEDSYIQRYKQLQEQTLRCNRQQLVDTLKAYNQSIGNHSNALHNIERLIDTSSVVVIGGQQPGILTGPLYTIHKVITLLTLAKREEARLGVPVIPVFWIAGEDHDWDEVNHLFYVNAELQVKKHTLSLRAKKRASISHVAYDLEEVASYIDTYIDQLPRTEHSAGLRELLHNVMRKSDSFSSFFARLLAVLFGEDGVVLIDSADERMRSIEGEMFRHFLQHNTAISECLMQMSSRVQQMGYTPQVESTIENANLFFYDHGVREALIREENGFRLRNQGTLYTKEEMIQLTYSAPERFSCNVVTRPLMQEYLFPVLAFVGGPGEISYWALYRDIFHQLGMNMPILIPRITMTIVDRAIQRFADQFDLSFDDLIHHLDERKETWLQSQDMSDSEQVIMETKERIRELYQPLREELVTVDPTFAAITEKNLAKVLDQVRYLERKLRETLERRHAATLAQFTHAKQSLMPNGSFQERTLNIFMYINLYGMDWWNSFKSRSFVLNGLHKEVRL